MPSPEIELKVKADPAILKVKELTAAMVALGSAVKGVGQVGQVVSQQGGGATDDDRHALGDEMRRRDRRRQPGQSRQRRRAARANRPAGAKRNE